jgi:hypothetical protein
MHGIALNHSLDACVVNSFDQYLQSATFRKSILRISNEKPVVPFGTLEL